MKGVNNKSASQSSGKPRRKSSASGNDKVKPITSKQLVKINKRLDLCLPMETPEWQKLEQLLMQMTEFAPSSMVYQIGMAAAVYADNQAHRAYVLGGDDARKSAKVVA